MITFSFLVRFVFIYLIVSIIGLFTKKKLNPRFEEMIEKRLDKVTMKVILYFATFFGCTFLVDISKPLSVPLLLMIVAGVMAIQFYCGYEVALLKGNVKLQAIFWGILSITGIGFLVLLQCTSYRPIDENPPFNIYRGKKLKFKCASCGTSLMDYECNIGTEGVCPTCKTAWSISKD